MMRRVGGERHWGEEQVTYIWCGRGADALRVEESRWNVVNQELIFTTYHLKLCDAFEQLRAFGGHKKSKIGPKMKKISHSSQSEKNCR